jgi:hypothetical protein
VLNPAFELAYWKYGLSLAQVWRERLGLQRHADWDKVLVNLSALPEKDGLYIAHEAAPDSYENPELLVDHPMAVGALGMLPQGFADQATMRRTFQAVLDKWQWRRWTWGWDYPLMAMCAARLGEPDCAVDVLLMDTPANRWLVNGHCFQAEKLPIYLPANGGLLTAAALMAAGWDNCPATPAPGFPKNGQWQVRSEGLLPLP